MPGETGVRHMWLPHALGALRQYVGNETRCSVPILAPAWGPDKRVKEASVVV